MLMLVRHQKSFFPSEVTKPPRSTTVDHVSARYPNPVTAIKTYASSGRRRPPACFLDCCPDTAKLFTAAMMLLTFSLDNSINFLTTAVTSASAILGASL
ncbi:hypothetical protein BRADI_4g23314v3 [Brachypodium distachyon]|uniref:Uncharacterized protein n=1 Tax=Brachypodium distachyon TaxID=15368 RepID=A0A0Q3H6N2_BRADI|nr:hypothetical protein BRADI_4g23314v3 [Brachypodium distachyon]PNT63996.1 hypothetical protein BRADI_4g23314v3 [Brachypodium distachyon]